MMALIVDSPGKMSERQSFIFPILPVTRMQLSGNDFSRLRFLRMGQGNVISVGSAWSVAMAVLAPAVQKALAAGMESGRQEMAINPWLREAAGELADSKGSYGGFAIRKQAGLARRSTTATAATCCRSTASGFLGWRCLQVGRPAISASG